MPETLHPWFASIMKQALVHLRMAKVYPTHHSQKEGIVLTQIQQEIVFQLLGSRLDTQRAVHFSIAKKSNQIGRKEIVLENIHLLTNPRVCFRLIVPKVLMGIDADRSQSFHGGEAGTPQCKEKTYFSKETLLHRSTNFSMKRKMFYRILLACFALLVFGRMVAQIQEMRGVWIATVINLDWPSQRGPSEPQQQELVSMLDRLQQSGINAVFFQVRSEADAFYPGGPEPWSYYLTGRQGQSPQPFWDPVAFMLSEAHRRGIEVHLWLNPYRVVRSISGSYPKDSLHLSVKRPEWMMPVKNTVLLDPGIPEGRVWILQIIRQLAKRYQPDGIHLDDYFYPYEGMADEDRLTFERYGGSLDIHAWREQNIDDLVKEAGSLLASEFPGIKWGISPFGIWKSGTPEGIIGLSGATVTYGNALHWLSGKWVDYIAPQLYWAIGGNQDFLRLSDWWAIQGKGRHLYPGLAAYKAEPTMTALSSLYQADELPKQIRHLRSRQVPGYILFRAANIHRTATQGLAIVLANDLNRTPVFTPSMPWKDMRAPAPVSSGLAIPGQEEIRLQWRRSEPRDTQETTTRFYGIYVSEPKGTSSEHEAGRLVRITSDTFCLLAPDTSLVRGEFHVRAATANSILSQATRLDRQVLTKEKIDHEVLVLEKLYPNPSSGELTMIYRLSKRQHVSIRLFDMIGRSIGILQVAAHQDAGTYSPCFQMDHLPGNAVYWIALETEAGRIVRKWVRN